MLQQIISNVLTLPDLPPRLEGQISNVPRRAFAKHSPMDELRIKPSRSKSENCTVISQS
jgi:hypothetical protein